jgi:hypothetical protein
VTKLIDPQNPREPANWDPNKREEFIDCFIQDNRLTDICEMTNLLDIQHKNGQQVTVENINSVVDQIGKLFNLSTTHGNQQFKYQTLISCNKNAVYWVITQTSLLEAFPDLADGLSLIGTTATIILRLHVLILHSIFINFWIC